VPSDDTSADGGGGNKGDGGGGDAGTDADPNGCVTVGPRSGTVATSTPRTGQGAGGVAWQSPENARAADETPASADLSSADSTEDLLVSGYGFTGVTGMRVVGVEVELKREAPEAGVTDGEVFLTLDGQKSPMSHYLDLPWPTSIFGTHVYGGATDTWGMTLTEAGACGTPAVATRIAGHEDAVDDSVSGLLVDTMEEVADAAGLIIADDETRARLGRGALRVAERYSWDRTALIAFEQLARQVRRGPGQRRM